MHLHTLTLQREDSSNGNTDGKHGSQRWKGLVFPDDISSSMSEGEYFHGGGCCIANHPSGMGCYPSIKYLLHLDMKKDEDKLGSARAQSAVKYSGVV